MELLDKHPYWICDKISISLKTEIYQSDHNEYLIQFS